MGLIRANKKKKTMVHGSTKGFKIGAPEAEAERDYIDDYFEDYLNVIEGIVGGKFMVTGRKGAGKTAVAKYIDSIDDGETLCSIVGSKEVEFQKILQALPDVDCCAYFEWIILVKLTKMIIDAEQVDSSARYISDLKKFYERNTGAINISGHNTTQISSHSEVQFGVLKNSFSPIMAKFYRDKNEIKGKFYEFVPALREIIITVLKYPAFSEFDFFVCFDDLDVGFKVERDSAQLLDLIRVAKRYNTEYLYRTDCKVLIFLRDDIHRHLKGMDADVTKIFGSYENKIRWYDHSDAQADENATNIKKFINKRIAYNFRKNGLVFHDSDPWRTLFEPSHRYGNNVSSFKFVLNHTFYRPRDFINFLIDIGSMDLAYPIKYQSTLKLLNTYSDYCVGELQDELAMLLDRDGVANIFKMLEAWAKDLPQAPDYDQVKELFSEFDIDFRYFDILRDYDIIIPKDPSNGDLFCQYREKQISADANEYVFTLHKAVYVHFKKYRIL